MPGRLCMFDDKAFKQDISNKFGVFRDIIGVLNKQYNIAPTLNIAIISANEDYFVFAGIYESWYDISFT